MKKNKQIAILPQIDQFGINFISWTLQLWQNIAATMLSMWRSTRPPWAV